MPDHPPPTPAPSPDFDDAELLRAFIDSRDDLAFGRIVARHAAGVRRTALLETGNAEAAEDVTQATFIVLSRRPRPALRSAKRKSSAEPWLHQVARYAAANWRRAEHRRRKREKAVAMPDRATAQDPSQSTDLAEAVAAALRTLRRRDRRLILLRHVEEKPWSEVAQRVNMTPEAARKATDRAMERLREELERQGITARPVAIIAGLTGSGAIASSGAAAGLPIGRGIAGELARGAITMMNIKSSSVALAMAATIILSVGVAFRPATPQQSAGAHINGQTMLPSSPDPDALLQRLGDAASTAFEDSVVVALEWTTSLEGAREGVRPALGVTLYRQTDTDLTEARFLNLPIPEDLADAVRETTKGGPDLSDVNQKALGRWLGELFDRHADFTPSVVITDDTTSAVLSTKGEPPLYMHESMQPAEASAYSLRGRIWISPTTKRRVGASSFQLEPDGGRWRGVLRAPSRSAGAPIEFVTETVIDDLEDLTISRLAHEQRRGEKRELLISTDFVEHAEATNGIRYPIRWRGQTETSNEWQESRSTGEGILVRAPVGGALDRSVRQLLEQAIAKTNRPDPDQDKAAAPDREPAPEGRRESDPQQDPD